MNKEKIKTLATQCLYALELVAVAGEQSQLQLTGVRRDLRRIIAEANCPETGAEVTE